MPYPRGNAPRPAVLTPRARAIMLASIAAGHFLGRACDAAGLSRATFYRWRRLHQADAPAALPYADFFNAVDMASARAEAEALAAIRSAASGWRGAAWFLERRFPDRWRRRRDAGRLAG